MAETNGSAARKSFGAILLDCALAALITFVIAAPIMGLRTVNSPGGMTLQQHWGKVLTAVGVVFFGRLVLWLFVWNRTESSGFAQLVLRLVLAALAGFAVGATVCFLTLGPDQVSIGTAMESALLTVPWNIATLLFALAAFSLSYGMFPRQAGSQESTGAATPSVLEPLGDLFKLALLVIALALPFLPWSDRYILDLAILILTYIMLGWGLNVVVGLAGLLDLGYVAFYAVGAYSYALLATIYFPVWFPDWLMPYAFWIALPLAGILAALWGIMLGFPVLRLRGDYLAIVTLAFGEIIRVVLINWADFTGGPNGISGIPRPTFFGIPLDSSDEGFAARLGIPYAPIQRIIFLYYIILGLALITNMVTIRLRSLPLGRAWEALREDEIACRSLGINTTNTKLTAFAIGAMFGGFAGSFFATRQGFISPESFVFMESALILAIVVLGGLGSQIGVVISAIVMIGGFEAFRNLDFLRAVFGAEFDPAQYRMIVFGLAMVSIMIWRPRGLVTRREPSIYLKERKAVSGELVAEGRG
jgi:branched-chain amino acid transport system permease protein